MPSLVPGQECFEVIDCSDARMFSPWTVVPPPWARSALSSPSGVSCDAHTLLCPKGLLRALTNRPWEGLQLLVNRIRRNTFASCATEDDRHPQGTPHTSICCARAMPVFRSLACDEKLTQQWKAGKGWVSSSTRRICPGTKRLGPWKNSGNH